MKITPIHRPHLMPTSLAGSAVLKGFNPKKIASLDSKGCWIENPETPIRRAVNEILFHLWEMDEKQKKSVLDNIINLFIRQAIWPSVLRIRAALIKNSSGNIPRLSLQQIEKELIDHYKSSKKPEKHISFHGFCNHLCELFRESPGAFSAVFVSYFNYFWTYGQGKIWESIPYKPDFMPVFN